MPNDPRTAGRPAGKTGPGAHRPLDLSRVVSDCLHTNPAQCLLRKVSRAAALSLLISTLGLGISSSGAFAAPVLAADASIADISISEGDAGTKNATFTVTLSAADAADVTLDYATADGTAIAGSDYTAASGTLTILAGNTSGTISVPILGDTADEADETFTVTLSNPSANATIVDDTATGTIVDDDGAPALSINDVAAAPEGDFGTTNATFTVSLSAASASTITVDYATADGTAAAGSDYSATSGSLTFNPGETSKTINVPLLGDTTDEADETFLVGLSNAVNASIADGSGTGTIADDDAAPSVSIDDTSVNEGDSGTVTTSFTVGLSAPSGKTVTVDYATADLTAEAGSDYAAVSATTLTFAPGETSKTVSVTVNGDVNDEVDETFTVSLSSPVNASLGVAAVGTGTIVDDDAEPSLAIADASVVEGNAGAATASFTVDLSVASGKTVTVDYATADGSATAGSDYTAASGTLTFAPGETSKTIAVTVAGDTTTEGDESFSVALSSPSNATIADAGASGTIADDDGAPTLSIDSVAVAEGNAGSSNATFTVTLSNPSASTVTVDYATADGTAAAGSDYTATSGTLTVPAGDTTATITVPVSGDVLDEADETFTVALSNATNASIATGLGTGTGTIADDDPLPALSIDDVSLFEGNSGTTSATFTVSLSAVSGRQVTVNYATADNSATLADADYSAASGTLTFLPGETSKTIVVAINGDLNDEVDENFRVNLIGATNATIADSQGVATIRDEDSQPTVSIADASVSEGDAGTKSLSFTVSLSTQSSSTVLVGWATSAGTATAGTDFASTAGTVSIPAGSTSGTVNVTINGDTTDEPDETLTVTLSSPLNATIADGTATGTIADDDAPPSLSIADDSVAEGDAGTVNADFQVTLSAASEKTVTVDYATSDGTALSGSDYSSRSGTLTFAPGETSKTISVPVTGDTLDDGDSETFSVALSGASNASIADGSATGTIADDDPVSATVSIADAGVAEGNSGTKSLDFTVSLSTASGRSVTVDYATANGTASAGSDYTSRSGTLTFASGETSKTISVPVSGDTTREPDETLTVSLSNVSAGATILDDTATGTITNDDGVPALSINDRLVTEGNSGTTTASFTVSLSNPSDSTITVDYATADGSAKDGSDYVAKSGTLTFAPGDTSKTIGVVVVSDTVDESNETFTVGLSNATGGATISDDTGTGTITDDDSKNCRKPQPGIKAKQVKGTRQVNFTGQPGLQKGCSVASVSWTFGDGGTSTSTSNPVSHTYAAKGVYTVTYQVVDTNGNTATKKSKVKVK